VFLFWWVCWVWSSIFLFLIVVGGLFGFLGFCLGFSGWGAVTRPEGVRVSRRGDKREGLLDRQVAIGPAPGAGMEYDIWSLGPNELVWGLCLFVGRSRLLIYCATGCPPACCCRRWMSSGMLWLA
jgi:hypothetical protein